MTNVTFHPERNSPEWQERIEALLTKLDLSIVFQKTDGSLRTMECTLKDSVIPAIQDSRKRKNAGTLTVYDTQKQEWRSMKWDRIVSTKWG